MTAEKLKHSGKPIRIGYEIIGGPSRKEVADAFAQIFLNKKFGEQIHFTFLVRAHDYSFGACVIRMPFTLTSISLNDQDQFSEGFFAKGEMPGVDLDLLSVEIDYLFENGGDMILKLRPPVHRDPEN